MEFCEEVLDIAKEFISPDKTFKERIGGIFLLYGLFLRMPYRGPRIRMIMTEWENLLILQCEFYKEKQYEAIYILQQLIKKRAFGYCLFEQEVVEKIFIILILNNILHYLLINLFLFFSVDWKIIMYSKIL